MNEEIRLITVTRQMVNGHETETETSRTVWAGARSVTRSEYYQSYQAGLNAAKIYKVNKDELGDAEYVDDDTAKKRYRIIRTYEPDVQYVELTVEEKRGAYKPPATDFA